MTLSRVTYTLESSLESVNLAERSAEQFAANMGFDEETCQGIGMAVREAAVNAVLHGNGYDAGKRVTVSYESSDSGLTIKIADQGKGLDPKDIPDPLAPENLLKQSGRGIFLIRAFMDGVEFKQLNPGTEVTLIKHIQQPIGKESSQ
jgi:serine/threonine-protein kinase RsbW